MGAIGKIWGILTRAQRRRFVVLQLVSVLMALSTVLSLAAVMGYFAVLANPRLIESQAALHRASRLLGLPQREFLLALGAFFMLLLAAGALLNVLGSRSMGRFAYDVGDRVRSVLFSGYLRSDYLFHVRAGSAQLMNDVLYQADRVTISILNGQVLLTNGALTLMVVVSIAVVSPLVALAGALVIGGSYLLCLWFVQHRIARNGKLQTKFGAQRVAVVQQAFLGIKYLKVARAQEFYGRRFESIIRLFSRTSADTQFIGQFPRYILECVAGVALIACGASMAGGIADVHLPQLAFMAFAGFRLLPAFQQMYYSVVIIRAQRAALEAFAPELERCVLVAREAEPEPRLAALRSVDLAGVSFRYAPGAPWVLENASLHVPAGAAIGIIGPSGCGKTTLVDLVLGLLTPAAGRIAVNGEALETRNLPGWHRCVGYVPQDIMILDASVGENIAFGVEPGEIDHERLREVARLAGALEFIESLPGGFGARISGGAGNLSGGQRQRIGIARALYGDPALLVLDEATNALDADTERGIVDDVIRARGTRTIIVIAHGTAAIAACDRVYELCNGTLCESASAGARLRVAVGGFNPEYAQS